MIERRRSGATNWVRADSITGGHGSSSALVQRAFHTAMLLQSLDRTSTLKQAVRKVCSSFELSRDETAAFAETAIAMAKRLYRLGFLVPSKS